ncbi:MAG: integrase arm-type DNA-binding domain-containing protein [Geobacter sp.]|nr:integrase arm-type DNA-binding domain-containing protein [Geobacter sp.]
MKFTDIFIRNLKPEAKKYYKRESDGFVVRVMPSGVKTWLLVYTVDGRRKEMNLGQYPYVSLASARERYNDAKKILGNGLDPGAIDQEKKLERRRTPVLADFVDEYIKIYAKPKLKSWEKIEQSLKREIVPILGKKKITDIKRRDVVLVLDTVASRAPVMANRLLAYVRHMFSWAVDRDVLEINPLAGMKRPGGKEESRERNLTPEEIKALWTALDRDDLNMTDEIRRAIKLVLVTAQRPGEVINIHASEINGNWWTIPGSKTKNGQTHRVYLTKMAVSLLGDVKGKGFVFKAAGEDDRPMTELAMNMAIRRHLQWPLKDAKGNHLYNKDGKPATENRLGVAHFTPHDLRRTATTLMAQVKVIKEHRERVTNHKLGKIDGTYNLHDYDDEKQMALEALERKLLSIVSGAESNVIPITAGKKAA